MAKKHWIKDAISHPGALTEKAEKAGVSLSKFESEKHRDPTTRRQVALAKTLKKVRKK